MDEGKTTDPAAWSTGDFVARCRSAGVRGVVFLLEPGRRQGVSMLGDEGSSWVEVCETWENEDDLPTVAERALVRFRELVAKTPN